MASYYYEKDNKVIFNDTGELIYYIPEKYFNLRVALSIGEVIQSIGIFSYGLFDKNGKKIKISRFKCPTMISCKPSSISKESSLHLIGTKEPEAYRLLHFTKGDELLCSTELPKSVENVEKFLNLLVRGNLPQTIPYDELYDYIIENAELNGFNYKVSGNIIGILISELYRDSNDLTKEFRLSDMKNMNDYTAIPITKVPKYTSPYAAITSENADEAIAAALINKGSSETPLEKVVMD